MDPQDHLQSSKRARQAHDMPLAPAAINNGTHGSYGPLSLDVKPSHLQGSGQIPMPGQIQNPLHMPPSGQYQIQGGQLRGSEPVGGGGMTSADFHQAAYQQQSNAHMQSTMLQQSQCGLLHMSSSQTFPSENLNGSLMYSGGGSLPSYVQQGQGSNPGAGLVPSLTSAMPSQMMSAMVSSMPNGVVQMGSLTMPVANTMMPSGALMSSQPTAANRTMANGTIQLASVQGAAQNGYGGVPNNYQQNAAFRPGTLNPAFAASDPGTVQGSSKPPVPSIPPMPRLSTAWDSHSQASPAPASAPSPAASGSQGGSSSGTPAVVQEPPCAACKSLRRKCTRDCIFLPYFPRDDPDKFARVHKVFGASNVAKMLQDLPAHQREDAVASLEYEAQARVQDPVFGCVGILCLLQKQVTLLQAQVADLQRQQGVGQPQAIQHNALNNSLSQQSLVHGTNPSC